MKNLKISRKLILSFFIIIVIFIGSSTFTIIQLQKLGRLEHEGTVRAKDAINANELSAIGYQMYQIIAHAQINKNIDQTKKDWDNIKKELYTDLDKMETKMDTDEELKLLKAARDVAEEMITHFEDDMIPLLNSDTLTHINIDIKDLDEELEAHVAEIEKPLHEIVELLEAENIESAEIYDSSSRRVVFISIIVSICVLIITVIFIFILVTLIAKPLLKGVEFATKISNGDLTAKLDIDQKDEVGLLAASLNVMVEKFRDIVTSITAGADNVASASEQISSSTQQLSQGASEQASSTEEVSSSMEEMASNIQQNTDNSQQTEKIAINASDGITKVASSAQESLTSIRQISEKITIINDIAFQTNILALNAAVEAARAGEHGKGFAVVAAEVRKLAERSKVAADEINNLSKHSLQTTESAGDLVEEILPEIQKTAKLVQEISAASLEQNSGTDQINGAIQQLSQVTQQNAAASEEMATSSEELSNQAEQLRETIAFFKTEDNDKSKVFMRNNLQEFKPTVKSQGKEEENKNIKANNGFNINLVDSKNLDSKFESF